MTRGSSRNWGSEMTATIASQGGPTEKPAESPLRVLLVEDDSHIGRLVESGFVAAGHQCDWAKTGPRGLEAALSQRYDVVILDMMLPEMSGLEVLARLRAQPEYRETPILALTASAMAGDRDRALEAGFSEYISKPVNIVRLRREVARFLAPRTREAGS